jgi:hypothetical protein
LKREKNKARGGAPWVRVERVALGSVRNLAAAWARGRGLASRASARAAFLLAEAADDEHGGRQHDAHGQEKVDGHDMLRGLFVVMNFLCALFGNRQEGKLEE